MRISHSGKIYNVDSFFPEGLEGVDYELFLSDGYLKEVHPQNVTQVPADFQTPTVKEKPPAVVQPETTPVPKSASVAAKSGAKNGSHQSNSEPSPSNS